MRHRPLANNHDTKNNVILCHWAVDVHATQDIQLEAMATDANVSSVDKNVFVHNIKIEGYIQNEDS